jgi:hypothetical protein
LALIMFIAVLCSRVRLIFALVYINLFLSLYYLSSSNSPLKVFIKKPARILHVRSCALRFFQSPSQRLGCVSASPKVLQNPSTAHFGSTSSPSSKSPVFHLSQNDTSGKAMCSRSPQNRKSPPSSLFSKTAETWSCMSCSSLKRVHERKVAGDLEEAVSDISHATVASHFHFERAKQLDGDHIIRVLKVQHIGLRAVVVRIVEATVKTHLSPLRSTQFRGMPFACHPMSLSMLRVLDRQCYYIWAASWTCLHLPMF